MQVGLKSFCKTKLKISPASHTAGKPRPTEGRLTIDYRNKRKALGCDIFPWNHTKGKSTAPFTVKDYKGPVCDWEWFCIEIDLWLVWVSEVAQSCLTLWDPVDCSLPGSSIRGIFQARILEWAAISFSTGSSQPRDWTCVSCIAGRHFMVWATREAIGFLKLGSRWEGLANSLRLGSFVRSFKCWIFNFKDSIKSSCYKEIIHLPW